jgi:hypothetical protein
MYDHPSHSMVGVLKSAPGFFEPFAGVTITAAQNTFS